MFSNKVSSRCLQEILSSRKLQALDQVRKSSNLILTNTKNHVTTLTFNNPKKLNAWTVPMIKQMFTLFDKFADEQDTKALVITGTGTYYCAGANLSENIKLMHPKKLHKAIAENNEKIFNYFLDFPKPILVAANGPAIGASVTSASLCDAILASESATFLTPFARLGVTPEGCSSVHFERVYGKQAADKLLIEGAKLTSLEARQVGLVVEVVKDNDLPQRAQEMAESWVQAGRPRTLPGNGNIKEYKEINIKESAELADAFVSYKFLDNQYKFLKSKNKEKEARLFWYLKTFQPFRSKLV